MNTIEREHIDETLKRSQTEMEIERWDDLLSMPEMTRHDLASLRGSVNMWKGKAASIQRYEEAANLRDLLIRIDDKMLSHMPTREILIDRLVNNRNVKALRALLEVVANEVNALAGMHIGNYHDRLIHEHERIRTELGRMDPERPAL